MSDENENENGNSNNDADSPVLVPSSDRRNFLSHSATSAAAMTATAVGITAATVVVPTESAVAAVTADDTAGATNTKIYTVAPQSLLGKTIVITGGTTGLGLESAKRLALGGANIIITARTPQKGELAVRAVQEYVSSSTSNGTNANIYYAVLDLDDLQSVKSFPERFKTIATGNKSNKKIDVLMNNAGVMAVPTLEYTKDGNERTFQSNHLGHFVLTSTLFSSSLLSEDATIINVSSEAYNFASVVDDPKNKQGLDLNNLNGELKYGPWSSYGLSKLANIMFTQELQRRLVASNSNMSVYTLHPGAVNTDLARNFIGEEKYFDSKQKGPQTLVEKVIDKSVKSVLKSVEEGASTQIYLAASTAAPSIVQQNKGAFYVGYKPEKLPEWAKDVKKANELWKKSEEISGVTFKL